MDAVKAKRMLLAGAVAIITATGAYAGAVWKTDTERKQVIKQVQQETTEDKIARLEAYRARLVNQKTELEVKIAEQEEKKRHRGE